MRDAKRAVASLNPLSKVAKKVRLVTKRLNPLSGEPFIPPGYASGTPATLPPPSQSPLRGTLHSARCTAIHAPRLGRSGLNPLSGEPFIPPSNDRRADLDPRLNLLSGEPFIPPVPLNGRRSAIGSSCLNLLSAEPFIPPPRAPSRAPPCASTSQSPLRGTLHSA